MSDVIRFAALTQALWPNGAGRKADIAAGRDWSVSYAWLDRDAPFSDFSGFDRNIILVEGPGFTLRFSGAAADIAVRTPFEPTPFVGGWPTRCEIAGPCVVLNVFAPRAIFRHAVSIVRAAETIDPTGSEAVLVVVLQGSLSLGADIAETRDALLLTQTTAIAPSPGGAFAVYRIDRI